MNQEWIIHQQEDAENDYDIDDQIEGLQNKSKLDEVLVIARRIKNQEVSFRPRPNPQAEKIRVALTDASKMTSDH